MTRSAAPAILAVIIGIAGWQPSVNADFHFYYIKEIFSNHDGSVQFIELFTDVVGQQNLNPAHSITSTAQSFPFPSDGPTPTNGRHLLLATAGFGSIAGGATPNFTIPSNFFNPAGDTITFGEGVSVHTFGTSNPLPIDGVNSLNYTTFFGNTGIVAANSPRNHAGAGTSVNLPPPIPPNNGDYNGDLVVNTADYTVWRNTLGTNVDKSSGADGNNNSVIDTGDYTFWKDHYGDVVGGAGAIQGNFSAVPEPASGLLALVLFGLLPVRMIRSRRRALS